MTSPIPHDLRKLTVEEFLKMVEVGVVEEHERVELLDGWMVEMAPQDPPHSTTIQRLQQVLARAYGDLASIRQQFPLKTGAWSLPEPDLCVVPGLAEAWDARHPEGAEAWLVVEVANTRVDTARAKAATYASAGVPTYWIVDVAARRVEVHEQPLRDEGRYARVRIVGEDEEFALPRTDVAVCVGNILPKAR